MHWEPGTRWALCTDSTDPVGQGGGRAVPFWVLLVLPARSQAPSPPSPRPLYLWMTTSQRSGRTSAEPQPVLLGAWVCQSPEWLV